MGTFNTVDINILSLVILLIIFVNLSRKSGKYLLDQRLFVMLLGSNAALLVLDTILWILNGKTGTGIREILLTLTALYFMLNPVPSVLWSLYAHLLIHKDEKRTQKWYLPYSLFVAFNAIVSIVSCFKPLTFYIDPDNVYHRGKLFYVMAVLCYALLVNTMIMLLVNHRIMSREYYIPALVFVVPPIIGSILQSMFYGISLAWSSMAVACLIVFVNIQNSQLFTDYLTGLFNRNRLDSYLQGQLKNNGKEPLLAGIMIDLNNFKRINDIYGHTVGDQALKRTGEILKKSFREGDFVARYGGDEFLVLFRIKERQDLLKAVERIRKNTEQTNQKKSLPFRISLSLGFDVYDAGSGMTVNQFFKHIDELMYRDKKKQKLKPIALK